MWVWRIFIALTRTKVSVDDIYCPNTYQCECGDIYCPDMYQGEWGIFIALTPTWCVKMCQRWSKHTLLVMIKKYHLLTFIIVIEDHQLLTKSNHHTTWNVKRITHKKMLKNQLIEVKVSATKRNITWEKSQLTDISGKNAIIPKAYGRVMNRRN